MKGVELAKLLGFMGGEEGNQVSRREAGKTPTLPLRLTIKRRDMSVLL
jgi:hypothetical protein